MNVQNSTGSIPEIDSIFPRIRAIYARALFSTRDKTPPSLPSPPRAARYPSSFSLSARSIATVRYCSPDEINSGRNPARPRGINPPAVLATSRARAATTTRREGGGGSDSQARRASSSLERRGEEGSQGTSKKEGNKRRGREGVMKERSSVGELVHEEEEEDLCGCISSRVPVAPRTPTPFRCTACGSEINGYRGLPSSSSFSSSSFSSSSSPSAGC